MSVTLMGYVWRISFPTQSQKLIALKLADHSNDEGGNIWPSKERVARDVGCSETTVQLTLKVFREAGILEVLEPGGKGPRSTTKYRLNVELLQLLAVGSAALEGNAEKIELPSKGSDADPLEAVDNSVDDGADKGSETDPLPELRGRSGPPKGVGLTGQGVGITDPKPSLRTTIEPSLRAPERAQGKDFKFGKVKGEALTRFDLTAGDVAWKAWVTHLENLNRQDLIDAATKAGSMTVFGSRWPKDGAPLPRIGELAHAAAKTDRIVGSK